jgi:hypothetical protein
MFRFFSSIARAELNRSWLAWYFKVIIGYVLLQMALFILVYVLSLIGQPIITFLLRLKIGKWPMPAALAAFLTLFSAYRSSSWHLAS